jgi:hypothetical protein
MNSIRKFSSLFASTNSNNITFIGRWSVPNSSALHINQIVDRNNEDHCGVCITYDNNNVNNQEQKMKDENEDYLLYRKQEEEKKIERKIEKHTRLKMIYINGEWSSERYKKIFTQ